MRQTIALRLAYQPNSRIIVLSAHNQTAVESFWPDFEADFGLHRAGLHLAYPMPFMQNEMKVLRMGHMTHSVSVWSGVSGVMSVDYMCEPRMSVKPTDLGAKRVLASLAFIEQTVALVCSSLWLIPTSDSLSLSLCSVRSIARTPPFLRSTCRIVLRSLLLRLRSQPRARNVSRKADRRRFIH